MRDPRRAEPGQGSALSLLCLPQGWEDVCTFPHAGGWHWVGGSGEAADPRGQQGPRENCGEHEPAGRAARSQGQGRGDAGEVGLCWKASTECRQGQLDGSVPFLPGVLVCAPVWRASRHPGQ